MMLNMVPSQQILQRAIDHHHAGRLTEAENGYRQVLQLTPKHPQALNNLGLIAYKLEQHALAIDLLRQAVSADPANGAAHKNLGAALKASGQTAQAITAYTRAIKLDPNDFQAHTNLGNALRDCGRPVEAVTALQKAVEINPRYTIGYSNLGGGLADLGDFPAAIEAFRQAIHLQPDLAGAHFNLALVLLQIGDPSAWQEYEWRWKFEGFSNRPRNFPQPRWDGQPLVGRALFLHAEQGLGDTIQFIRYLPHLATTGAKIIVECQPELKSLIEQMPAAAQVIQTGESIPAFEVHCPLLSLPLVCGMIPAVVPYLFPPEKLASQWKQMLSVPVGRLRVGLAWAGSPTQQDDKKRSMHLDQLAPLATVKRIDFFSLQKGPAAAQASSLSAALQLIDHTHLLNTMADTAALISQLDLIITVDTSIAHLAGAMGKPVWIMLAQVPAWQWPMNRAENPWYPTARLFHQTSLGDWTSVVRDVADRLSRECDPT